MSIESAVLCALLRLARRRSPGTMRDLLARVAAEPRDIRRALAALARANLVHASPTGPRLTLAGFAVAVATAQVRAERGRPQRPSRPAHPVARVLPLARRRRAA